MMHGIIKPLHDETASKQSRMEAIRAWCKRHRAFLLVVIAPTLIAAAYYYLWASDQYGSETHFVIRSSQGPQSSMSGLGSLFALGGGTNQSKSDAMSVIDYLDSIEAVEELNRRINIVERFSRPDVDLISRLRSAPASTPEGLLKYYRKHVSIRFSDEGGISSVSVKAFTPKDALLISENLLIMGEQRVNSLNKRSYQDTLASSNTQLAEAETALAAVQVQMTQFRRRNSDLDPEGSGKAQIGLVTQLTASLTLARAQLAAMSGTISPNSPQYVAMAARVRALEAQVAGQAGILTGRDTSIANRLGDFESLRIRQEFAAKRYEAAAAAYQAAREDARKKRLYLVRIVNPNLPVKSLYPERLRIVLTVFFSLLVAYAIGWLLMAGVKEHANT